MNSKKNILAVDIGASKTNLGIFSTKDSPRLPTKEASLVSKDFASAAELLQYFLDRCDCDVDSACIGVPGPVLDNQSTTTNLPWLIDGPKLAQDLAIKKIELVNDLEAAAASVPLLQESDLYQLNKGLRRENGNKAVISPGTGLGEAFLCKNDGNGFTSYPSEGGHCDFAPSNSLELELLAYLQDKIGHVSSEQVCSGLGIVNIYRFLKESTPDREPEWLLERFAKTGDWSRVIIDVAMAMDGGQACPLCRKTLELFASILGAEAGNMALKVMAHGGVYLGGGIPPRITGILDSSNFLKAFLNKGRMSSLLADIPVHIITNLKAPMLGAAAIGITL
ncbi:MAG: glucokinase [Thermodesulfobacteriota bacterium]